MPDDMLTWRQFYDAVGATFKQVRQAMDDLGLEPLRLDISDFRKTSYKREWVEQVRKQILANNNAAKREP